MNEPKISVWTLPSDSEHEQETGQDQDAKEVGDFCSSKKEKRRKMSSSSREYSPDWLRAQAPPTSTVFTLSSSSESINVSEDEKEDQLPISSVIKTTSQLKSPLNTNLADTEGSKGQRKVAKGKTPTKPQEPKISVWTLPSDSEHEQETGQDQDAKEEDVEESPKKRLKLEAKDKSLTKQENEEGVKVLESEKQTGAYISYSSLPLVLADKVQRSKALVECEGDSIDLSGDLGSVGRVVISDSHQDMLLDLKGTIYKTTIIPSRTFCIVSFGQSEAKIEAIMNDFIQLKPQSNVYEAETMVEGTLEGFSFDSEDEAEKHTTCQTDENEGGERHTNGKGRGKSEAAKKKGKAAAVKKPTTKKVKRKAPVAKKTKTKK